ELRVAEEELRSQNEQLLNQRASTEAEVVRYRELFMQSPAATFVTDSLGTILDLNPAAARLIRRPLDLVVRKPLAALVERVDRDEFRRRLSRLDVDGAPRDWTFTLMRGTDLPITVCATIRRIGAAGNGGRVSWLLSAPQSGSDQHVWDFDQAEL